jgi:hypothetical protein
VLGGIGAGMGFLTLVLYLVLILNDGDDKLWEVAPWVLAMAAASSAAAAGAATGRRRPVFFAGAIFMVIGVPAIFSVGFPLIVASLLCVLASRRAIPRPDVL